MVLYSNIGNIRHQKAAKNSTLFKNNKIVFLYPFFSHTTIILFQVEKKLEKRNGEMVLYLYFAFNRQAVPLENESWYIIKKMAINTIQIFSF